MKNKTFKSFFKSLPESLPKSLNESEDWVSFEISDPKTVKFKSGFHGKGRFKSKIEALSVWNTDSSDIVAMTLKDYEKKYGKL